MIEQVCAHIHNYFIHSHERGEFTIEDGRITVPFLVAGQFFRIQGSRFNDGVHVYPAGDMTDETFQGTISEMRPPKRFLAIVAEIEQWNAKYAGKMQSPFQSESFKGYSYTLKSGADNTSGGGPNAQAWQKVFAGQLNEWRRLA